jgi:hypothetical protein
MFEFRKLSDPPLEEGSCRIYGALLDQVKALRPGQVLRLQSEDGTVYGLVHWSDLDRGAEQRSE